MAVNSCKGIQVQHPFFVTDPSSQLRGWNWVAGLDCLLNIIRALRMGSCLSAESRSPRPPTSGRGVRKKNTRKNLGSRSSSFDRRDDLLRRIPGRMFLNGASGVASMFTQQGRKGTNQDAMIVWENFGSRTDTVFCGVFDGHGPYGHLVAKRVRDSLPLKLNAHWDVNKSSDDVLREISFNTTGSMNSEDTSFILADEESRVSVDLDDTEKHPDIFQTSKESFLKAFKVMDRELRIHANIDCYCSGTTAVTLVKQGQDVIIGNVGDSRAILGTRDNDDFLVSVQLTVDLKPNLPAEAERIRKCKGRVFALQDEPEVSRVWLPNNNSPGLAMARAFGDFCLKDYGLISVPEISYRRITDKDEFIVMATDGIWDVLSNKEVVNIIASAPLRSSAARTLVEAAVRAWRYKYPTSKVDDCAVICLFLDTNNVSSASATESNDRQVPSEPMDIVTEQEDLLIPTGLDRNVTVRTVKDILPEGNCEYEDPNQEDGTKNWSALEGVSRVNTLLTLPRFVPSKGDEIAAGEAKSSRK